MPGIAVAKRRRWAPGPGAKVDLDNPISEALSAVWSARSPLVSLYGPRLTPGTRNEMLPTRFGPAVSGGTTAAHYANWPEADVLHGGNATILVVYRKTGASTNSGGFGTTISVDGNRCGAHLPYGDGTIYWDYGGSGAGNRITFAGHTFSNAAQVFHFCAGTGGSQIWIDGERKANSATSITRTANTNTFYVNGGQGGTPDTNSGVVFLAIWKRTLTQTEIAATYADPFCFLR